MSGRSSGVEHNLAKVGVEGSNPFARSNFPPGSTGLASRVFALPSGRSQIPPAGARMTKAEVLDDPLAAPRALAIEGGHNLRDMGGYRTRSGRRLKWGMLYRSGAISNLTSTSREALRRLGIMAICDFRTPHERERVPMDWYAGRMSATTPRNAASASAACKASSPKAGISQARCAMRCTPSTASCLSNRPGYRQLFHLLSTGHVPLLFNCAAGKDRTGLAAALILDALDVPRETIEHDYTLTNQVIGELETTMRRDFGYAGLATLPREEYSRCWKRIRSISASPSARSAKTWQHWPVSARRAWRGRDGAGEDPRSAAGGLTACPCRLWRSLNCN